VKTKKPSVLACVTSQFDCDRIIKTARTIADDCGCELRVLSVLKPMKNYSTVSDQIEYLNLVSREAGSDMTVIFDSNAPKAASDFAKQTNAVRIVTGMHDGGDQSFLVRFNELSPNVSITMVAKDNKVYSMDLCKSYS
jgi:K+-sensing histidine kinase KdpD